MSDIEKLEVHYFLKDSSHSMDAVLRNKCETEFLAIANEIIQYFDLGISIDAEALKEGGLKEIWKFVGKNSAQIAIIISLITLILTELDKTDNELLKLQKEETQLSIEEKKLSIEKLKRELKEGTVNQQSVKSSAKAFTQNAKIAVRKSNFYRNLQHYEKVTKVGYVGLDKNNLAAHDEIVIPKSDFSKFILLTNKLPVETINDAQIEIVAPVLREGNAKWKGIYIDQPPISFEMKDQLFKEQVLAKQISFKSGDIIICVMEIHRELNEVGEVIITKYSVQTVLEKIENGVLKETQSGKKYRREKELMDKQGSLDFLP